MPDQNYNTGDGMTPVSHGLPLGPEPKKVPGRPADGDPTYVAPPVRRTPSQELLRYFAYDHLPEPLKDISGQCALLARWMNDGLPDGPEKTTGLRKLLEAKDCFVRAALPKDGYPLIEKEG